MSLEAFFFGEGVFGVWRAGQVNQHVWVLVPPFGEEEKSARRTLTDIAQTFHKRGEGSLLFSFRGTGDSSGDLAALGLEEWREDLRNALAEVRRRAVETSVGLLGVRLGASLALQTALEDSEVSEVVLIEPLLSGRSFLSQQMMRQKIRAQMTGDAAQPQTEGHVEDLDGWALGEKMKSQLQSLDVMKEQISLKATAKIIQVGPKPEVAPPLRALGEKTGASTQAVVMPPFWNLLDYSDPSPLLDVLESR